MESTLCKIGVLIAGIYLALCLTPGSGAAAPVSSDPIIVFDTIHHGGVFDLNNPNYDSNTQQLLVGGVIHNLANPNGFHVRVQGNFVPISTDPNGDLYFVYWLNVGPNPPGWPVFRDWPANWPDREAYEDPHRVHLPVMADLVDNSNQEVVSRDRVVLLDIRAYHDSVIPYYSTPTAIDTVEAQLTPAGLAALSPTHIESMHWPSMEDFTTSLADKVANQLPRSRTYDEGDLCYDLTSSDPFVAENTPAWIEIRAQAELLRLATEECDRNGAEVGGLLGGAIAGIIGAAIGAIAADVACSSLCVQVYEIVNANDFELCIGRIYGELVSVSPGDVSDATLAFKANNGVLTSQVYIDAINATARVTMSDMIIRWKGNNCSGRPKVMVTQADLDAVGNWELCNNISLWTQNMESLDAQNNDAPLKYNVDRISCLGNPWINECLDVTRPTRKDLVMSSVRNTVDDMGICGKDLVNDEVHAMVLDFYDDLEEMMNSVWHEGDSRNREAQAIDALLNPFEIGQAPLDLHTLDADVNAMFTNNLDGMYMRFTTSTQGFSVGGGFNPSSWFYMFNDPFWVEEGGKNLDEVPFDIAYAVSTPLFNQVLHALSSTAALNIEIPWSVFKNLINLQPNASGLKPSVAAFLRTKNLKIRFRPTLTPITYMPLDLPEVPNGLFPVIYQGAQFILELVEEQPGNKPDKVWYSMAIDFTEPNLAIDFQDGNAQEKAYMDIYLTDDKWTFRTLRSAIPHCPVTPWGAAGCDKGIEARMRLALEPILRQRMQDLLSQIPAPQYFDADGLSYYPVHLDGFSRIQNRQNIIIYGNLHH